MDQAEIALVQATMLRDVVIVSVTGRRIELHDHIDGVAASLVLQFRRELFSLCGRQCRQREYGGENDERGFGFHEALYLLFHPFCVQVTHQSASR